MDHERFGLWTRLVAAAPNRRTALRLLATGVGAAVLPAGLERRRAAAADATPAGQIIKGCRLPGQRCSGKRNCCTNRCANKQCRCIGKGGSCLVDLGGGLPPIPVHANCCTNKCSKRDHKCK